MLVFMQNDSLHSVYGRREETGSTVVWSAQCRCYSLSELRALWSAEWSGKPSTTCHRFVAPLDHLIFALMMITDLQVAKRQQLQSTLFLCINFVSRWPSEFKWPYSTLSRRNW